MDKLTAAASDDKLIEAAFARATARRERVRTAFPNAELLGFASGTSYLIREKGKVLAVNTETLEVQPA